MNLKTYHAFTMAEALAAVKQHLGADAVILNTRTFRRGAFFGLWRRTIVEVTAVPAKDAHQRRVETPAATRKPNAALAHRAYSQTSSGVEAKLPCASPATNDADRTRTLALAMEERLSRANGNGQPKKIDAVQPSPVPPTAPTAKRFVLTSAESGGQAVSPSSPPVRPASEVQANGRAAMSQNMQEELSAIKDLVGKVLHRQALTTGQPSAELPKQLFEMYLRLISQEISDELADQIVNAVRSELAVVELEDESKVRSAVIRKLASYIPVATQAVPEASSDARPLTIALIGPTGVGKTTTLAKLAASFKLRHGKKVGLITSDTYRIAAVDQLRTYANIIGLPMEIALTPAEMRHAVDKLSDSDVILIDTAGRSQNDGGKLRELQQFIAAANPHEVHLVLSSTASEKVLLHEAEAFSAVGVHKIVLTKLDEAVNFGVLVNVIRQVGKQLSFVTTGQEVPTDLEIGRADRLAELILGAPVCSRKLRPESLPA